MSFPKLSLKQYKVNTEGDVKRFDFTALVMACVIGQLTIRNLAPNDDALKCLDWHSTLLWNYILEMISKLKWERAGLPHERKQTKSGQQKSYFGPHEVTREAEDRKEVGVMTQTSVSQPFQATAHRGENENFTAQQNFQRIYV